MTRRARRAHRKYVKPQHRKNTARTIESKAKSVQTAWRTATDRKGSLPIAEARELLSRENICPYCHRLVPPMDLSVDHKIPRSRGGSSDPENLVWCHRTCNLTKGALTDTEYLELLAWLDERPAIKEPTLSRLRAGSLIFRRRGRRR